MKRLILATLAALALASEALAADAFDLRFGGWMARAGTINDFSTSASTFALDANTDAYGLVMQMPEAATLTTVCWTNGFRTGTAPTYIASLQTPGTTGYNDGTILGGGTPASCTFANAAYAGDGASQCCTLANTYAATAGQILAVHIGYSSGTINASNNIEFAYGLVGADSAQKSGRPYSYLTTAGTPAKAGGVRFPAMYVKSASKTYGYPGTDIEVTAYSSDSTPDEYGMAFTLPAGMCDTFKLAGVACLIRPGATGKTFDVNLYSGTTLEQVDNDEDTDHMQAAGSGGERMYSEFYFEDATLDTLTCGTSYTVAFSLNSETSVNFGLAVLDVQNAAELSAFPGGTNFFLRTRTNAGAWTDVTDKRPFCELIIRDVTEPAGGAETFTGQSINRGLN
jgi:hypothetical protein